MRENLNQTEVMDAHQLAKPMLDAEAQASLDAFRKANLEWAVGVLRNNSDYARKEGLEALTDNELRVRRDACEYAGHKWEEALGRAAVDGCLD